MKNPALIILIVGLSLILIGLLIYGFVFLPKQQKDATGATGTNTPNPNGGGTSTPTPTPNPNPTPTISQAIKDLAQEFRDRFQGGASTRCVVIGKVNDLSNQNLRIFSDYYKTKFGLTPLEEMDDAWVWCATNNVDDTLYQKLEALELA